MQAWGDCFRAAHQFFDELGRIDEGSADVTAAFEDPCLCTKVFGHPLPVRWRAVAVAGRVPATTLSASIIRSFRSFRSFRS